MGRTRYIACALLMLCPLALSRHDDDFAFDNSDEFQVELTANHSEIAKNGLRRLWGVPDTSAYIGHLFRMEIPKEAFSGQVVAYKVRREDGRSIPSWLAVDSRHGLISGIPQKTDLGAHTFAVTAIGNTQGLTATDSFTIEVKKAQDKPHSKYGSCIGNENRLVLALLIDGSFNKITPRQRIRALMQLAHFMGLDGEEFWMEPYKTEHSHAETILSGAGSTQKKRGDGTTAIYLNVGCGSRLWARHKVVVAGVREQARDGTLEHLARLPLTGWRLLAARPAPRPKRQVQDYGSGDDEEYGEDDVPDYSGYDDDDEDDYNRNDIALAPEPVDPPTPAPHPHRHHHGEPHTTTDTFQTETPATTVAPTIQTSITTPLPDPTDLYTNPDLFAKTDLDGNSDLTGNSVNLGNSDQSVNLGNSDQSVNSVNLGNSDQSANSDIPSNVDFLTPASPPSPPAVPASPPLPATEDLPTREDTTPEPVSTNSYTTEEHKVKISPYSESASESNSINFTMPVSINPRRLDENIIISPGDLSTTPEPEMQTVEIRASNELPPTSTSQAPAPLPPLITEVESPTTQPSPPTPTPTPAPTMPTTTEKSTTPTPILTTPTTLPTTTPVPETTLQEVTKQDTVMPTDGKSTIIGQTTETVTFAIPVNQPPTLKHHMKKLAIIAGKAFRYIIPADLFMDPEEGSNLTFTMYEAESVPLSKASWIQFIPSSREVYGLPLESHVSRWNFMVEAADSEGLVARGPLDITVQQHKSGRTINHQFLMQFKLQHDYPNAIDWQIRALEGIVNLFRDTDMDHLTVLNATQTGDMYEFVWTNDTLPKDPACPMDDINRLMKIMEAEGSQGSPSPSLTRAMSPELSVVRVWWRGAGRCAPPSPSPPAPPSPDTYPPVTRNQVDHLTATPGHLLIYKVPDDTFFDPEDGGTRNLALSLRYSDRSPLGARHWLQFDARNQEFYGLPAPTDEGAVSYQLIAEDSSKKSAYDSLIVEVVKAPTIRPTVEFQMTMEYPFPMLAHDANNKRKVVEKLAALFGQKETDNIRVQSITDNPTTIIWYNTSLPMDRCPKAEIEELRRMIIQDERGSIGSALKENVDLVFDKDFKVMSIRLIPLGLCAEQNTKTPKTPIQVQSGSSNLQNSKAGNAADQEYLVTFIIPAVVIVCMILLAGVIACVLYRRRRTGKMSVGDEEERQAFRSKAPVIFQDELEERGAGSGSARHCSPVIMREEKPPLLPAPLYRPDAPYRPPPPFAATTTPPRPKPTPTYRKPPPYVPP